MFWLVALVLFGTLAGFAYAFLVRDRAKTEPVWSALEAGSFRRAPTRRLRQAFGSEPSVQEMKGQAPRETAYGSDPWLDRNYCWVVVCKNRRFHHHPNPFHVHRVPLAETDAVEPRPRIERPFVVRCGECGRKYAYESSEVLRYEMDVPPSFLAHPLFRG